LDDNFNLTHHGQLCSYSFPIQKQETSPYQNQLSYLFTVGTFAIVLSLGSIGCEGFSSEDLGSCGHHLGILEILLFVSLLLF